MQRQDKGIDWPLLGMVKVIGIDVGWLNWLASIWDGRIVGNHKVLPDWLASVCDG